MNTPMTIASCLVKSEPFLSDPNGDLTAAGTVNYFCNTNPYNEYTPTRISNVSVTNKNGVVFFGSERAEYSASACEQSLNLLLNLLQEQKLRTLNLLNLIKLNNI